VSMAHSCVCLFCSVCLYTVASLPVWQVQRAQQFDLGRLVWLLAVALVRQYLPDMLGC
jgi:hypothetical protein